MKVVFLGSPDFAIKPLESILNSKHEVIACVTQPDKPVGRKGIITPCDLKKYALDRGIKCLSYNKVRLEGLEELKELNADVFVTCAYGQILSQEILDIPKYGVINIHGSLLPKLRGAAPIQWSIINGDKETGVTIMRTDAGVDTGDIIVEEKIEIDDKITGGELFDKISILGSKMIVDVLNKLEIGNIEYIKQDESLATKCSMLKKEDGEINFNKSAKEINCLIRGLNPWPIAFTTFNGKKLKVYEGKVIEGKCEVGTIYADNSLIVGTGDGLIELTQIQLEGGNRMGAKEFLLGHKTVKGMKF